MTSQPHKPLVIVTGSSGLIGGSVCRALGDRYTIAGLDNTPPEESAPDRWFECDFTDQESIHDALNDVRSAFGANVASVVHLVAYYDFSGEPSPLYEILTVEGTRRLLHELREFDAVEQFVFSSSLLVMKPCEPGQKLTESSPTQAEWEYPKSKLAAEQVIRGERGPIPAVILRLAGVYNEQGCSLPITQNIRRIAEKEMESYFFPGDADRGQAFVHLDDAARSIEQVVENRRDLDECETFLIAEDECLSYERLQDVIGRHVHGADDWPTIQIPKAMAKAGAWAKDQLASSEEDRPFIKPWMVDQADSHYPVDNSLARRKLGWEPTRCLSETLPRMIANLKEDPEQWYRRNGLTPPEHGKLQELALAK